MAYIITIVILLLQKPRLSKRMQTGQSYRADYLCFSFTSLKLTEALCRTYFSNRQHVALGLQ